MGGCRPFVWLLSLGYFFVHALSYLVGLSLDLRPLKRLGVSYTPVIGI